MNIIRSFYEDESGATAIEYALIASLVAMAIIASFGLMINNIGVILNDTASGVEKVNERQFN